MIDLDKLAPTIAQTIAKQIVEGITQEDRDKILSIAVAQALDGWNFRHAVEKAVELRASELSAEYVRRPEQERRLSEAVENGFALYVDKLPTKIFAGLCEMMHGKRDPNGNYHQPGAILRMMEVKV